VRRRTWIVVAVAAAAVLAAGVLVWFQPQKLLIDERVDEALPAPVAPPAGGGEDRPTDPTEPRGPVTLAAGGFRSLGHAASGRAVALDLGDGKRLLRLEDLRTSNGPDLFVYLSVAPADGPRDAFDDDFVSLGRLKANQGNQNYQLAEGVELRRYRSVVVWCRRFTYAFGAAPLR
jgi:Electron transfer DM13